MKLYESFVGETQMYPELMVMPMREELTRLGIKETRTAEEVDRAVKQPGTTMLVVNSSCGCAASMQRFSMLLGRTRRSPFSPDRTAKLQSGPVAISLDTYHHRLRSAFCVTANSYT